MTERQLSPEYDANDDELREVNALSKRSIQQIKRKWSADEGVDEEGARAEDWR